jgi:hypothetical protein
MDNEEIPRVALANWTIKNMPTEVRLEAVACAARAGLSVAQWLAHAVRTQAQLEAGPVAPAPRRVSPIAIAAEAPDMPPISHMSEFLRETRATFQAAGMALPATVAKAAEALSTNLLRVARRASQTRARAARPAKTGRPTELENGQTLSLEHDP